MNYIIFHFSFSIVYMCLYIRDWHTFYLQGQIVNSLNTRLLCLCCNYITLSLLKKKKKSICTWISTWMDISLFHSNCENRGAGWLSRLSICLRRKSWSCPTVPGLDPLSPSFCPSPACAHSKINKNMKKILCIQKPGNWPVGHSLLIPDIFICFTISVSLDSLALLITLKMNAYP